MEQMNLVVDFSNNYFISGAMFGLFSYFFFSLVTNLLRLLLSYSFRFLFLSKKDREFLKNYKNQLEDNGFSEDM